MTDKQEQYKELNELVSKAYKAVNEDEAYTRKYGQILHFGEEDDYINSDSDDGWL